MYITPNTRGHYPAGYPRGGGLGWSSYDPSALETATDKPDLAIFKSAIWDATGATLAQTYFSRSTMAREWWYARWANMTFDGRKWGDSRRGIDAWPWPGASDTRMRTVEKVIGQHRTLSTYSLRNNKIQAQSTRPATSVTDSQQATVLMNWMLNSHMHAERHREERLCAAWRNGYGLAITKIDWKQMRRLEYIDVSVMGLQEFVNEPAVASFIGSEMKGIPIGENLSILDLQEMIMDPAYEKDLSVLLRTVSHDYLSLKTARKKLQDLRELRTVEIPVPYVFESRPRITTLRPMVDVLFPPYADDLQRVPWTAQLEYVSEVELRDRIVTANYDPKFVEQAIQHRGPSSNVDWRIQTGYERASISGIIAANIDNDIELYHFYSLVHDKGTPVRFHTVFHMDVNDAAVHEPDGYKHGESCFHPHRFETEDRPLLSSRGIAEIAYTWEKELKDQYDAQSDMTALTLRPPLMTTYDQVLKMKESLQPGVVFPMRKFDEYEFMRLPQMDQRSILIVEAVEKRIREHFALFGLGPEFEDLMKLRREEFTDDTISEWKTPYQQMWKLINQLLPDDEVMQVIGPLSRPFHTSKEVLQGGFEFSVTCDLRNIDEDWIDSKSNRIQQVLAMDVQGQINRTPILKLALQDVDYALADLAMPDDQQKVTQAEIQDEQKACDLMLSSGQDQPMPEGSNYQLRLTTLQGKLQSYAQNPISQRAFQQNPELIKVFQTREQFFTNQLQQQQNAQIGRMQVTNTFNKQAPTPSADPSGMQMGQSAPAQLGY